MPAQSRTFRRAFRYREVDGLPVAEVVELNGRLWTWCCPLCGQIAEILGGEIGKPFKPDCLLRKLAVMPSHPGIHAGADWARLLQMWQDAHPAAAAHDTVLLLDAAQVAALDTAQQDADRLAAAQQRQDALQARKIERERAKVTKPRGRPRKHQEKAA